MKRAFLSRDRKDRGDWSPQVWAPSFHAREDVAVVGILVAHLLSFCLSVSFSMSHSFTHAHHAVSSYSTAFIFLGSSTLIFNVFEPHEMGVGIILKTNASVRISDGSCSGGPAVRSQPCNAGNTSSVCGPARPHMPQGSWARVPQVMNPHSGCQELQPLSHGPQLLNAPPERPVPQVRTLQLESSPCLPQLEKSQHSQK